MKTMPCIFQRAAVVAGAVLGAWLSASTLTAAAAPTPLVTPKSVFIADANAPGFGRDPFFPASKRNGPWAPVEPKRVEVVKPPPVTPVKPVEIVKPSTNPPIEIKPARILPTLALSGVSQRTAIINNISFLKGESNKLMTAEGTFQVRLDEIKSGSVVVTVWFEGNQTEQIILPLGNQ